jgi:hypothetical protein
MLSVAMTANPLLEHTIKHQKFLSPVVYMTREVAGWRIADNRSGARYLVSYAVQHAAVNARHG